MKEKLSEVKAVIKSKAGKIITAAKQEGKAALNKVAEFPGIKKKLENIRQNVQEYGEKKFSKTELIKKPFQAKRKLLSGILNCADAAIAKIEQLAADVKQYQTDKTERETAGAASMEAVSPIELARVAEPEFQYGQMRLRHTRRKRKS